MFVISCSPILLMWSWNISCIFLNLCQRRRASTWNCYYSIWKLFTISKTFCVYCLIIVIAIMEYWNIVASISILEQRRLGIWLLVTVIASHTTCLLNRALFCVTCVGCSMMEIYIIMERFPSVCLSVCPTKKISLNYPKKSSMEAGTPHKKYI